MEDCFKQGLGEIHPDHVYLKQARHRTRHGVEPQRHCEEFSNKWENACSGFLHLKSEITCPPILGHVLISKTFPNEDFSLF